MNWLVAVGTGGRQKSGQIKQMNPSEWASKPVWIHEMHLPMEVWQDCAVHSEPGAGMRAQLTQIQSPISTQSRTYLECGFASVVGDEAATYTGKNGWISAWWPFSPGLPWLVWECLWRKMLMEWMSPYGSSNFLQSSSFQLNGIWPMNIRMESWSGIRIGSDFTCPSLGSLRGKRSSVGTHQKQCYLLFMVSVFLWSVWSVELCSVSVVSGEVEPSSETCWSQTERPLDCTALSIIDMLMSSTWNGDYSKMHNDWGSNFTKKE